MANDPKAMAAAGAVLERVINTEDFVGVRYLETGVNASRAVGRVDIRDQAGRVVSYGTGSLVSPELLLTNNHVLPDADTACASVVAGPACFSAPPGRDETVSRRRRPS
jgi:endonuclease G